MLVRSSKKAAKAEHKRNFVINDYGQLMEINELVFPWQKIIAHAPRPAANHLMPDARGILKHNERVSKVFAECSADHDWKWKQKKRD